MDDSDMLREFVLDLEKVTKQTDMLAVTRLLASNLMKNPYMTVGDFMRELSNDDLDALLEIANVVETEAESPRTAELMLIAEMLAKAEGVTTELLTHAMHHINALIVFLSIEDLARKGLVKVYHDKFSFGEDMASKIICDRLV